jgi:hypothetical protein
VRKRAPICSICRREIADGEGLTFSIKGEGAARRGSTSVSTARKRTGRPRWRSVRSSTRRSGHRARSAIADELLALWRRGIGPSPADVLHAIAKARAN